MSSMSATGKETNRVDIRQLQGAEDRKAAMIVATAALNASLGKKPQSEDKAEPASEPKSSGAPDSDPAAQGAAPKSGGSTESGEGPNPLQNLEAIWIEDGPAENADDLIDLLEEAGFGALSDEGKNEIRWLVNNDQDGNLTIVEIREWAGADVLLEKSGDSDVVDLTPAIINFLTSNADQLFGGQTDNPNSSGIQVVLGPVTDKALSDRLAAIGITIEPRQLGLLRHVLAPEGSGPLESLTVEDLINTVDDGTLQYSVDASGKMTLSLNATAYATANVAKEEAEAYTADLTSEMTATQAQER